MDTFQLIDKLCAAQNLSVKEYEFIILNAEEKHLEYAAKKADEVRKKYYGNKIFIRGLIEISSHCKNNCRYCGIRCANKNAVRYRLSEEEIIQCCAKGYKLGFRTFVLQGGEDLFFTDDILCKLIEEIKKKEIEHYE